jgi:hypothetical protein
MWAQSPHSIKVNTMTPEAVYEQLVFLRLNDFENNMKESFIDIVQDYVLQKTPIQMMRATITFT